MRTTDFSNILFEALQYAGQDRHNIRPETFAQFRDFCNARLRSVWELANWPEVIRLSPFTSITDPVTQVPYFTPAANVGEVLNVYTLNPQVTTRGIDVGYELYSDGTNNRVILGQKLLESGFYRYRIKLTPFNGDLYSATIVYYVGSQVYSGNFYTCLATTNVGENPTTHPAKWAKIEIPYAFGPYMSWGSAADWMVSEGNVEGASVLEQKANGIIDLELDKVLRQQGQFDKINMTKTY